MMKTLAISALALGAALSAAHAQSSAPSIPSIPTDETMKNLTARGVPPVLDWLMKSGVKLTYLGDAGGLEGYIGESATGVSQVFYLTPDKQHVIAGVLFREGGTNVTGVQINDLQNRYEAAKKQAERAAKGLETASPDKPVLPGLTHSLEPVTPSEIQAGEAAVPSADEYLSNRNAEEVRADLDGAAWFKVGADEAPIVYMVADPNCPFCHRMWRDLRPMVMSREIQLRILMIAGLRGSEPKAISILSRDEPSAAWFAGEGSVRTQPVAPPPPAGSAAFKNARKYLARNHDFVEKYDIQSTPYLLYVDDEGLLRESSGIPKNQSVFFSKLP